VDEVAGLFPAANFRDDVLFFCRTADPIRQVQANANSPARRDVASEPLRILARNDCLRQFLDAAVLGETSQMAIQKHLLARSHPQNGACARRGRPFDNPWITQVFGEEIVKCAEHIRMDKENRPARCGAYASKIFGSAGARVDKICFESAARRCRRPSNGDCVHGEPGRRKYLDMRRPFAPSVRNRKFLGMYIVDAGFAKAGYTPFHRFRHGRRSCKAAADFVGEPPKICG
jgi:hypothetical protein